MKRFYVVVAVLCLASAAVAQKADAAFVVGGSFVSDTTEIVAVPPPIPGGTASIKTDHRIFFEGALGVRLLNAHAASLHVELPVAGITSQDLTLKGGPPAILDRLNTLFITPGLRLKILAAAPISPWASVGGGWAHYRLKDAGLTQNKAALQFGGGLDFKTGLPLLGFRAEVRDFVTGDPNFGVFSTNSGLHHHNILVGGGVVLRF